MLLESRVRITEARFRCRYGFFFFFLAPVIHKSV